VQGCGRAAADAVARYHGGEVIEFPSARNVVNLLIARAMVAGGASHNDVQKALGVSWRTARRIRDRLLKQGIPQLDMQPVKDPRKHNPNQIDLEDLLAG
jgi:transposase